MHLVRRTRRWHPYQRLELYARARLQDIADTLVSKEAVDLPTLLNMTAEQLHACGAPMGKAIKFAKARGALSALPLSHRRFTRRRSLIESPHVVRSHTAGCVPAEREHGTLNLSEGFSGIDPPPVTPRITSGQALNPQACKSNLVASTHAEQDGTSPPTDLGNISEAGANDDCEGMSTSTGPDSFSAWEARGKSGEGEDGMAHAGRIMQFAAELQPYGLQVRSACLFEFLGECRAMAKGCTMVNETDITGRDPSVQVAGELCMCICCP